MTKLRTFSIDRGSTSISMACESHFCANSDFGGLNHVMCDVRGAFNTAIFPLSYLDWPFEIYGESELVACFLRLAVGPHDNFVSMIQRPVMIFFSIQTFTKVGSSLMDCQ